jgi:TM2 domain-containing membrane protein YozV
MQSLTDDSTRFCYYCGFENPNQYIYCVNCRGENPLPVQHYVPQPLFTPMVVAIPKSRKIYIILGLLFGWFGLHNLYANRKGVGATQLVLFIMFYWTLIAPVALFIWSVIEIINVRDDGNGVPML